MLLIRESYKYKQVEKVQQIKGKIVKKVDLKCIKLALNKKRSRKLFASDTTC